MAHVINSAIQLASHTLRFGWYWSINQVVDHRMTRYGARPAARASRPMPSRSDILTDLAMLMRRDAEAVAHDRRPPLGLSLTTLSDHLRRIEAMLADLPATARRRAAAQHDTARAVADPELPDYYRQDFHFQTGGYLTAASARLYDVQVETLFYGAAQLMRRAALDPIADFMRGKDQRGLAALDVACGTGRLLREIRVAFPALRLTGLDLSQAYLDEAATHLGELRPVRWLAGNAEHMPLADASIDIVTCTFLFHELPPEARRQVTREMARVLRPGGMLVLIDSLQLGDRPGWDGLLETFPQRFHEPYFRQYAIDDLDGMLDEAGLQRAATETTFLAKLMVRTRA